VTRKTIAARKEVIVSVCRLAVIKPPPDTCRKHDDSTGDEHREAEGEEQEQANESY
jgi:hypothetical protein